MQVIRSHPRKLDPFLIRLPVCPYICLPPECTDKAGHYALAVTLFELVRLVFILPSFNPPLNNITNFHWFNLASWRCDLNTNNAVRAAPHLTYVGRA